MNRIIVILLFLAFQSSLYSDEAIIKYDKSITVSPFHFLCPELHLSIKESAIKPECLNGTHWS